jgi:hypothetical protein
MSDFFLINHQPDKVSYRFTFILCRCSGTNWTGNGKRIRQRTKSSRRSLIVYCNRSFCNIHPGFFLNALHNGVTPYWPPQLEMAAIAMFWTVAGCAAWYRRGDRTPLQHLLDSARPCPPPTVKEKGANIWRSLRFVSYDALISLYRRRLKCCVSRKGIQNCFRSAGGLSNRRCSQDPSAKIVADLYHLCVESSRHRWTLYFVRCGRWRMEETYGPRPGIIK